MTNKEQDKTDKDKILNEYLADINLAEIYGHLCEGEKVTVDWLMRWKESLIQKLGVQEQTSVMEFAEWLDESDFDSSCNYAKGYAEKYLSLKGIKGYINAD